MPLWIRVTEGWSSKITPMSLLWDAGLRLRMSPFLPFPPSLPPSLLPPPPSLLPLSPSLTLPIRIEDNILIGAGTSATLAISGGTIFNSGTYGCLNPDTGKERRRERGREGRRREGKGGEGKGEKGEVSE